MVHVQALPGTPRNKLSMREIRELASREARLLAKAGFDAIMIENMHDLPYLNRDVGPEIVAAMEAVACDVRDAIECPLGVQILAGANKASLAVAHAADAQFIRAEGFVFAHVADEGLMQSDAGELLRYRKMIGAENIQIFADIKKKHSSHAITADVDLAETAHAAEFFGADGLIVTGTATGSPTNPGDLELAAKGTKLPILVGSGVTAASLATLWPLAHGFIIGSYLKKGSHWDAPFDESAAAKIVHEAYRLRG